MVNNEFAGLNLHLDIRVCRQVCSESERRQDFMIKDTKKFNPPVDAVRIRIEMNIAQNTGICCQFLNGHGCPAEYHIPGIRRIQPFIQSQNRELGRRDFGRPFCVISGFIPHKNSTGKMSELGNGPSQSSVVFFAVDRGFGKQHIESHGFGPVFSAIV